MFYTEVRVHGASEFGQDGRLTIASNGGIPTIEAPHLAIHKDSFVFATDATTAAGAGTRIYHIKALANRDLHSIFDVVATAGAHIELYELPSSQVTADGTAITHARAHRGSTVGSSERYTTFHTPTLSTGATATMLMKRHNGGTATAQGNALNLGGGLRSGEELVFPSDIGKAWLVYVKPEASLKMSVLHEYYEVG